MKHKVDPLVEKIHQLACTQKQESYKDPHTGYTVFTQDFLQARGYCCQNGCRHCPYGFENNPQEQ